MKRRTFSAALAAAVLTPRKGSTYQSTEQKIAVRTDALIGTIRPELHGHFIEHLGSCVYGGLWVGKNSPIPNINGHRREAVEHLKKLGLPVLRWPGGCFADDYHWRDGIGPAEKRPKTVNIHWGNYTEDNSYGTHEFIELCRLIGAEPYLAGNVGSGTPQELRDWVEYCNFPSGTTLSDLRAANGSPEPFRVRYWGVGNENWGCGGNMSPQEYASHYRRYATYLRNFGGTNLYLIACGPSGNDMNWSRGFLDNLRRFGRFHGWAMHYYLTGRSPATRFSIDHLREQLTIITNVERAIVQQRALLDTYDPERRVGLLVDEWGVWDQIQREDEKRYGRLFQPITMRSAVAASMGLNVFHRQAEKVAMSNIAQTVNVLHALLLTDGPKCVRTTTYYAYELAKPHRSKTAVRVETGSTDPLGVSMSASREGNELVVTAVNPRHDTGLRLDCALSGQRASSAAARMLHHADLNAANTFEQPDAIVPRDHSVSVDGQSIKFELPPLSVVTVIARLA